jgi:hypothetical protein
LCSSRPILPIRLEQRQKADADPLVVEDDNGAVLEGSLDFGEVDEEELREAGGTAVGGAAESG